MAIYISLNLSEFSYKPYQGLNYHAINKQNRNEYGFAILLVVMDATRFRVEVDVVPRSQSVLSFDLI